MAGTTHRLPASRRPLRSASSCSATRTPPGRTAALGDLWLDGSFAAFRRLHQDVFGFRQQAASGVPGSDPALDPPTTGAKLVGRWPSGASLETSPNGDDGNVTNAFGYAQDGDGFNVPRFAHVRKANPRDEQGVGLDTDPSTQHRMLRRGAPFGPPLPPEATADDGVDRGLHFISVVSDLDRQFEFVQRQWLNDPNFPNGAEPPGPTAALRAAPHTGRAERRARPDRRRVRPWQPGCTAPARPRRRPHLPVSHEIVTVTAGEYLFAPSLSALARLAAGAIASTADAATQTDTAAAASADRAPAEA